MSSSELFPVDADVNYQFSSQNNSQSHIVEKLYHISLHEHVTARFKYTCILTQKKINIRHISHEQQIKHGLYELK